MSERDRFEGEISRCGVDAEEFATYGDLTMREEIADKLNSLNDRLETVNETLKVINSREELFNFPPTEYPEIDQIQVDFQPYSDLWGMATDFYKMEPEWMQGPLVLVDLPQALVLRVVPLQLGLLLGQQRRQQPLLPHAVLLLALDLVALADGLELLLLDFVSVAAEYLHE